MPALQTGFFSPGILSFPSLSCRIRMPSAIHQLEARMLKPLFVILAALAFLPPSPRNPPPRPPVRRSPRSCPHDQPSKAHAESQARAKKLYGYDCAMCHGPNGNGKGGTSSSSPKSPSRTTRPRRPQRPLRRRTLLHHQERQRPDALQRRPRKADELWNMVILVRSFSKNNSPLYLPRPGR